MLRAITVDDELPNHALLKKFLEDEGEVQVVAQFSDPLQLLEKALEIQPDVAFVDIEMPVMNGLELAERLLSLCPNTQVVFVTAYSQYAIEAFHVNAVDYLLKPIVMQEIKRVIQKIINNRTQQDVSRGKPAHEWDARCRIHTFGCFDVYGFHSKQPIQWLTSKVEELFAYLLLHVGKNVGKEELCDVLWPDSDHENGMMNLYSTVYRLRKTFAKESVPIAITSGKYGYQVEVEACYLDFREFEKLTSSVEIKQAEEESESDVASMQEAVKIYNGELFGVRSYLWSAAYGESLNQTYRELSYRLIHHFIHLGKTEEAINCLRHILKHFPDEEMACILLMKLYHEQGDEKLVDGCHEAYVKYLDEELGVEPSLKIQSLFKSFK